MPEEDKKDINNQDDSDSGKEKPENKKPDSGDGKKTTEGGDGQEDKGLTKADIETIVKESIAAAVKDIINPEIDRRISGASKTIYKKVGVKEDQGDDSKDKGPKESDINKTEMINIYAKTKIKEELGKVDKEILDLAYDLVKVEIRNLDLNEDIPNEEHGNQIGEKVAKAIQTTIERIEQKKVDALKKAGQVIDIGTGGKKKTPKDDYESGKQLAEQRHPKKDKK